MAQNNTSKAVSQDNRSTDATKPVTQNADFEAENAKATSHGYTAIEDSVISKIAGMAAREVSGVYALGGQAARMVGALRDTVGASTNVQQGVSVNTDENTADVEVAIVAEYGVAIHELAEAIRQNIINAVERMTGLTVNSVNVTVHDVHLELEEDEPEETTAIEGRKSYR